MADREIVLRCDCGVEHIDVDLYFTRDSVGATATEMGEEFDEGYLTISHFRSACPAWRERLRSAWAALCGRDYRLGEVVLKPADCAALQRFFAPQGEREA